MHRHPRGVDLACPLDRLTRDDAHPRRRTPDGHTRAPFKRPRAYKVKHLPSVRSNEMTLADAADLLKLSPIEAWQALPRSRWVQVPGHDGKPIAVLAVPFYDPHHIIADRLEMAAMRAAGVPEHDLERELRAAKRRRQ